MLKTSCVSSKEKGLHSWPLAAVLLAAVLLVAQEWSDTVCSKRQQDYRTLWYRVWFMIRCHGDASAWQSDAGGDIPSKDSSVNHKLAASFYGDTSPW